MEKRLKKIEARCKALGIQCKADSYNIELYWGSQTIEPFDSLRITFSSHIPESERTLTAAESLLTLHEPGVAVRITQGIPHLSTTPTCNGCPFVDEKIFYCKLLHKSLEHKHDIMGYVVLCVDDDCPGAGNYKMIRKAK